MAGQGWVVALKQKGVPLERRQMAHRVSGTALLAAAWQIVPEAIWSRVTKQASPAMWIRRFAQVAIRYC